MGKILVLFDSRSGNTAEMARYVGEGVERVEGSSLRVLSVDQASKDDFAWCDGIAVGSPTNMGTVSWKLKKFFDEDLGSAWGHVYGKIGCAFSSAGGLGGWAELTCQTITNILINFGLLVFGLPDYVDKTHTLHYGAVIAKAPREEHAQKSCQLLGQRLAEWVSVYVDGNAENHPLKTRKHIVPE